MKAYEIMNEIFSWAQTDFSNLRTCDTLKAGSPDTEVTKVAVTCFSPVDVIRRAAEWGAQLLIVHEPIYFDHWDDDNGMRIVAEKRAIIEGTGLTIYRYHDHPHAAPVDMIFAGTMEALGLTIRNVSKKEFGLIRMETDPITPRELAKQIESKLKIAHVRICGAADVECTKLSTSFGAPGTILEELDSDKSEIVVVGEICEWRECEFARDAAALGHKKALLLLGHCGSERQGMRWVADRLRIAEPSLEVKYFDTDEVYTYPEK